MKKKFLTIFPIMIFLILGILTSKVEAKYKSNDPTVKSGGTITITVTSTEALENYDLSLGKHDGLTYVSCSATNAAVNSGAGKISFATLGTPVTTLGTYTFKAPQVTQTTKYTVTFNVNGTTNTSTVTVNPVSDNSNTPSSNNNSSSGNSSNNGGTSGNSSSSTNKSATVTSCKVNGITIKQDLKVTNKESVTVVVNTSNGEEATVYNDLTNKSYTVKSGVAKTVQVVEGTNTLTISLSNGYKTTRKIYSQKEEEVKPNNIEEDENKEEDVKLILKSLSIEDFELSPEFSSETYEYTINIPKEKNDTTKLDIKAVGDKENFTVEINGNEDLSDGENVITILVKSPDTEKIATYKIKVNKEAKEEVVEAVANVIETNDIIEENSKIDLLTVGIVVFATIVAIAGIIFAVIEYKYGKNKQDNDFGNIPYSNIGFEKEFEEQDNLLKEEKIDNQDIQEQSDNLIEDLYNKKANKDEFDNFDEKPKKRGKHF